MEHITLRRARSRLRLASTSRLQLWSFPVFRGDPRCRHRLAGPADPLTACQVRTVYGRESNGNRNRCEVSERTRSSPIYLVLFGGHRSFRRSYPHEFTACEQSDAPVRKMDGFRRPFREGPIDTLSINCAPHRFACIFSTWSFMLTSTLSVPEHCNRHGSVANALSMVW